MASTTETLPTLRAKELTKWTIIGNVSNISIAFLMSFTAFHATVSLQTSLYHRESFGNKILIALNLAAFLSNLLLAIIVNGKLGLKWSMFLCLLTHSSLPFTNIYPIDYVLYFGAVVTGLGAGPLWSAKSTYLTVLGEQYANLVGGRAEDCIARFFGIFFMVYYASLVLGNIISSVILQMPHQEIKLTNATLQDSCAANFCYGVEFRNVESSNANFTYNLNSPHFSDTQSHNTMVLFSILSACSLLSSPLVVLLTTLKTTFPEEQSKVWPSLLALLRQLRKREEVLLMPLALYSGIIYAFITADFCVGYLTCTIGIDNVGFVMSTFGMSAGLGAIIFGPLVKYTGRKAIFAFGGILNLSVLVALLKYSPTTDNSLALYAFAGLWGIITVIWTSQYLAFIGYIFRDGDKEAAFTCNYTWQMIGTCSWHAISTFLCIDKQIFVMIAILSIGIITYVILEIKLSKDLVKPEDDQVLK